MNLLSPFRIELSVGRTILLAWLTASFLYVQWGITVLIRDMWRVEFILQIGLLFGYFIVLMVIGRAIACSILLIISLFVHARMDKHLAADPNSSKGLISDSFGQPSLERLGSMLANLADVTAMFVTYLLYFESRLDTLAPLGLAFALILYILGKFNPPVSSTKSS